MCKGTIYTRAYTIQEPSLNHLAILFCVFLSMMIASFWCALFFFGGFFVCMSMIFVFLFASMMMMMMMVALAATSFFQNKKLQCHFWLKPFTMCDNMFVWCAIRGTLMIFNNISFSDSSFIETLNQNFFSLADGNVYEKLTYARWLARIVDRKWLGGSFNVNFNVSIRWAHNYN